MSKINKKFKPLSLRLIGWVIFTLSSFSVSATMLEKVNNSSNLQFILSKELPAGTYKIWNLSTNKKMGSDISKAKDDEAFGKISLTDSNKNDKFVILNSEGDVVFALAGSNQAKAIDSAQDPLGIGQVQNKSTKSKANSINSSNQKVGSLSGTQITGTDQLSYLDRLVTAQKIRLSSLEKRSRLNKLKLQRLARNKGIDCQKELDSQEKSSPEIELFCQSTKDLAEAYKKAEEQLKSTTQIKISALDSLGSNNKSAVNNATIIANKNLELPTNLDPKSLQVPAQTVANKSMVESPLGSFGLARRFYNVAEYCICQCGSS